MQSGNAHAGPLSQKRYAIGKSPATAVILSMLLVGLGQFYNGDNKKAILMMVIAIVGGILTHGIVAIVIYIWGWFDSHKVAKGKAPLWN
jgi:TM2 domain-containing membrane protein YozV